jgi:hypothetical protein
MRGYAGLHVRRAASSFLRAWRKSSTVHIQKLCFRCDTLLLRKNIALHIIAMLRQYFSFAPSLAQNPKLMEAHSSLVGKYETARTIGRVAKQVQPRWHTPARPRITAGGEAMGGWRIAGYGM